MPLGRDRAPLPTLASLLVALAITGACKSGTDVVARGLLEREQDEPMEPDKPPVDDGGGSLDDGLPTPSQGEQDAGSTPIAECDVAGVLENIGAPPWWLTVLVNCGGSAMLLGQPAPDPQEALRQLLEEPPIAVPADGSLGEFSCDRGDVLYLMQFGTAGTLCPQWCEFLRETTLLQIASQCGDWALFAERAAALNAMLRPNEDEDAGMP